MPGMPKSVCSPSAQLRRSGYAKYTNRDAVTGLSGVCMYRVLTCLTSEHDWRLVVLAGAICWLASAVAISLFHRARASRGRTRAIWIGLDSAVGGCGIWATHFVAMLAYDPGAGAGYSIPVTLLSLVFAIGIVAVGLCIALSSARWPVVAIGGAVIGAGVAAMHYT